MNNLKKVKPKSDNIDQHVGNNFKTIRISNGFTQEQTAAAVGVTFQQIQKYESGKNRMSASRLFQFSKFFQVQPNDFFAGLDIIKTDEQDNVKLLHSLDRDTLSMINLYKSIKDDKIKKSLLIFLKQCLKY